MNQPTQVPHGKSALTLSGSQHAPIPHPVTLRRQHRPSVYLESCHCVIWFMAASVGSALHIVPLLLSQILYHLICKRASRDCSIVCYLLYPDSEGKATKKKTGASGNGQQTCACACALAITFLLLPRSVVVRHVRDPIHLYGWGRAVPSMLWAGRVAQC